MEKLAGKTSIVPGDAGSLFKLNKDNNTTPGDDNGNKQQQQQKQSSSSDDDHPANHIDSEADSLCNDVHQSIRRAIDSTQQMPLSEHVLYCSYKSYDDVMVEGRRSLDELMSKLSQCSDFRQQQHHQPGSSSLYSRKPAVNRRVEFNKIENLLDKYDTIHDFSEQMFDKIGQNLDDAAGLRSRDAQLVQATLQAGSQKISNKMNNKSNYNNNIIAGRSSSQRAQTNSSASNINLSSSSSSSSSTSLARPAGEATSSKPQQRHTNKDQHQQPSQQQQQQYRSKKPQTKVVMSNQVNSVVQSNSIQQARNSGQSGGYLGKQQFGSPSQRFALLENKNISRPQNQFKDKIDNSYRPFEPLIRIKPNANTPLRLLVERDDQGNEHYSHPYEEEIQNFPIKEELTTVVETIEPPDLDCTPIILVENVQQLEEMCRHIEAQKEFSVDVEHHSYRTFQGITCLLQISTRTQDFVIDAIKLRSELYRLNNSFTNPDIVKVFHGADCDILWLQRDFGVYVVNLFDTSRAAKLMKFAHLSLAFLMKHYCRHEPDKSYQLADWRERPLPLPMLQYARADTHYLLYIYDRLRNDLIKMGQNKNAGSDLLKNVYERGREICLKRYEKPPFSETSHLSVLRKLTRSTFTPKQMFAFKELYAWRDSISRELDESVGYVLPNNLMIRISEYLPREPQGITALCNPIPPTVKKYLSDIHAIILKAIDVPLDETSKVITGNQINAIPSSLRSIDLDSISHKQDVAHSAGMQESSVPNLLDKMYLLKCSNDERNNSGNQDCRNSSMHSNDRYINMQNGTNMKPSRLYNFLDASWSKNELNRSQDDDNANQPRTGLHESIHKQFVSPYHRYMARNK